MAIFPEDPRIINPMLVLDGNTANSKIGSKF